MDADTAKNQLSSVFQENDEDDGLFTVSEGIGRVYDADTPDVSANGHQKRQWKADDDAALLSRYWDDKVNLDDGDAFLRDYIANMGWKTKDNINQDPHNHDDGNSCSSTDEDEFLNKVDEFETKYNFRFEEEGGHAISSHSRQVTDSVRVKDSKRKRERDSRKSKKKSEMSEKLAELERLKKLKKKEIEARLSEIAKATGNETAAANDCGQYEEILDGEFDPETHDKQMESLLGADYYDQADENVAEEIDQQVEDGTDDNAVCETAEEISDEQTPWYYCDGCIRPIQPGNIGYECKECEDITLCHFCRKGSSLGFAHPTSHKMNKFLVAQDEQPPSDWQSALMQIKKKKNKDIAKGKYDELFGMEYEDIVADIPCRFKYTKVESDSFGISTEAILSKSDKELNKLAGIKRLHPYRKEHVMRRITYHDKIKRNHDE